MTDNSDIRMNIRYTIVQLIYFPDNIKEYDDYTVCKYDNGIILEFHEKYILATFPHESEPVRLEYTKLCYINSMLELYKDAK